MFESVVPMPPPPVQPHPFAPPPPEGDTGAQKMLVGPLTSPLTSATFMPNRSRPFTHGGWQDISSLPVRRMDLDLFLENLKAHLEERFAEQRQVLDKLATEQHHTRELTRRCLSHLDAAADSGAFSKGLDMGRMVSTIDPHDEDEENEKDSDGELEDGQKPNSKPKGRSPGRADNEINRSEECWVDGEDRLGTVYRRFREIVESSQFDYVMGLFIILNTIFLGIQTDIKVRNLQRLEQLEEPIYFSAIETTFAGIFLLELICRLMAQRVRFFCSPWNLLDILVVGAAVLEECLKYGIGGDTIAGKVSVFRLMRVAKLLRTLRIIRVVRAFRELRVVLMSIVKSMRALFWTLCLLFVLLYFMSILVLVELSSHDEAFDGDAEGVVKRKQFFPSLAKTLLTVYQTTTGGLLWQDVLSSVTNIIPHMSFLWVGYVGLVVFAIMNTVTGIFVDQAMKTAHDDMRDVAMEEFERRELRLAALKATMKDFLVMGKSYINRRAMTKIIHDRRASDLMMKCDIEPRDLCSFFDLICGEHKRVWWKDIDDFLDSAFRLKGFARSMDIAALGFTYKTRRIRVT